MKRRELLAAAAFGTPVLLAGVPLTAREGMTAAAQRSGGKHAAWHELGAREAVALIARGYMEIGRASCRERV